MQQLVIRNHCMHYMYQFCSARDSVYELIYADIRACDSVRNNRIQMPKFHKDRAFARFESVAYTSHAVFQCSSGWITEMSSCFRTFRISI